MEQVSRTRELAAMNLRKKKKEDTLRQKRLKASEPGEEESAANKAEFESCLKEYDQRLGDPSVSSVAERVTA